MYYTALLMVTLKPLQHRNLLQIDTKYKNNVWSFLKIRLVAITAILREEPSTLKVN
jgi:hypothetical protein